MNTENYKKHLDDIKLKVMPDHFLKEIFQTYLDKSSDNSSSSFRSEIVKSSETHKWLCKQLIGLCSALIFEEKLGLYWGSITVNTRNEELVIGINKIAFHVTNYDYNVTFTATIIDSNSNVLLKKEETINVGGKDRRYNLERVSVDCDSYFIDIRKVNNLLTVDNNLFTEIKKKSLLSNKDYYFLLNIACSGYKYNQHTMPRSIFHELVDKKDKTLNQENIIDTSYDLHELFQLQKLCDVKLKFRDSKELGAHKIILAARSDVFTAMFDNDMKEKLENIIEIADIDYETFQVVLSFMYSGKFNDIRDDRVSKVLQVADKYNIKVLKKFCCMKIEQNLSTTNAVEMLVATSNANCESLMKEIINYICSNIDLIKTTSQFRQLKASHPDLINKIKDRLLTD